jgi:hypothetical protein
MSGGMATLAPLLCGPLRGRPAAAAFAEEVVRIHRRYATEIVAENQLCPFLRDVDTGFGRFCVMLDSGELDVAAAVQAVLAADSAIIHLVYPCVRPPSSVFEKFSGKIAHALKEAFTAPARPPVMATFHPGLSGDASGPYRLIGMLRRAPDPFVQFIPEGLHQGGTVFAGIDVTNLPLPMPKVATPRDPALANFDRLKGGGVERLVAKLEDIYADRERSYAPLLAALL